MEGPGGTVSSRARGTCVVRVGSEGEGVEEGGVRNIRRRERGKGEEGGRKTCGGEEKRRERIQERVRDDGEDNMGGRQQGNKVRVAMGRMAALTSVGRVCVYEGEKEE